MNSINGAPASFDNKKNDEDNLWNAQSTDWSILEEEQRTDWSDFAEKNESHEGSREHLGPSDIEKSIDRMSPEELNNFVHDKVIEPSDEFVEERLEESKKNLVNMFPRISEVVKRFEAEGEWGDYVADLANIIVEAFKIRRVPDLEILPIIDGVENKLGGYNNVRNTLYIKEGAIGLPNIIAHELWHAHQYESGDMLYRINNDVYIDGADDIVAYRKQLMEQEAFNMGDYFVEVIGQV